jgi:hypothetical protein
VNIDALWVAALSVAGMLMLSNTFLSGAAAGHVLAAMNRRRADRVHLLEESNSDLATRFFVRPVARRCRCDPSPGSPASAARLDDCRRKAIPIGVFATTVLIIALIEMWMGSAPIATESVTAAKAQTSSGAISPIELTLKNSKSLPDAYHGGDYTHLYRIR